MADYALTVLCRREPPAPPDGWGSRVWGIDTSCERIGDWRNAHIDDYELDARFVLAIELERNNGRPTGSIHDLACGLADAGDGIVLDRVRVMIPPRYKVRHVGVALAPGLSWSQLEAHIRGKNSDAVTLKLRG